MAACAILCHCIAGVSLVWVLLTELSLLSGSKQCEGLWLFLCPLPGMIQTPVSVCCKGSSFKTCFSKKMLPRTAQCFEDDSLDNLQVFSFLNFKTSLMLWNFINWCDTPCIYITGHQISFLPAKENTPYSQQSRFMLYVRLHLLRCSLLTSLKISRLVLWQ